MSAGVAVRPRGCQRRKPGDSGGCGRLTHGQSGPQASSNLVVFVGETKWGMAVDPQDSKERTLEDLLDGMRFAMLATPSPEGISSRPLILLDQDAGVLRFLVSRSSSWVAGLEPTFPAHAAFADPDDETYVAVSGTARINLDRSLIERLWNPAASAYFDGKDDPDAAVRGRTDDDEHGTIDVR